MVLILRNPVMSWARPVLLLAGLALLLCIGGCRPRSGGGASPQPASPGADVLADKPLARFQEELLDVAFDAASAIPLKPHYRDRALAQSAVVDACLELDQPLRAGKYIAAIPDWRSGDCYAKLAFYCAERGHVKEAHRYIDLAGKVADITEDWPKDRINVGIARVQAWLGQDNEARKREEGVEPFEVGKVAGVRAIRAGADAFDNQIAELDKLIATRDFDIMNNGLASYTAVYGHIYADAGRRSQVEEKIKAASAKFPINIRIDLLLNLADSALSYKDTAKSLELVNEAQALKDGSRWSRPGIEIPVIARLAVARYRAGDEKKARADLGQALVVFDAAREKFIVNIEQAGALRSVAEAYQSTGDAATALAVYKRAVEAGVENPNSRPRAEDLSATCCSMALKGVEPDDALWTRIRQIRSALGEPW